MSVVVTFNSYFFQVICVCNLSLGLFGDFSKNIPRGFFSWNKKNETKKFFPSFDGEFGVFSLKADKKIKFKEEQKNFPIIFQKIDLKNFETNIFNKVKSHS